jgi:hypothetical protein
MVYMQSPSGEVFTTENPEWHKECTKLTAKAGKLARKEYARSQLRKLIKPGQTVYCTMRSRSSSGMSRVISLHIVDDSGELRSIDNYTADATDTRMSKNGGLIMSGCGMDMGFALVYNLGYALWPNGTPEPHGVRNGTPDTNGGYALKSSWI